MTGSETQGVSNATDEPQESHDEDTELWSHVGFVRASRYRQSVMDRLAQHPMTPSRIADLEDQTQQHSSRALGELRERDLVHLLVPENQRKGRIYGLTALGHEVIRMLEQSGGVDP